MSVGYMEYFAGLVTEIKGDTIPIGPGTLNYTLREPLGVVGRIGAFNHPLLFTAGKCGAPLVTGNTLVVKPAGETPLSSLRIAELWADVFPPGVFNVVTGGRDAGAALVAHPKVAKIGFIGSVAAGRAVMGGAAATLKALTLELGGKNALIACADAAPAEVADGVVRGMNFRYVTGQSCNSTSRVYLHDAIYDKTLPEIVDRVAKIRVGLPTERDTEMSCLTSEAQYDKTMSYIKLGVDGGARLAYGGKRPADPKLAKGFFVEPTVFADVTDDMRIAREEIFGPVVSILRWSDEDDLLARVNALDVGLTASIWTHDLDRAHRLASRVEAGYVWINGASIHHIGVPFGGVKQSGIGREESIEELLACTQIKNVNVTLRHEK
jgi:betaine-aldehyde dehydrogenase